MKREKNTRKERGKTGERFTSPHKTPPFWWERQKKRKK